MTFAYPPDAASPVRRREGTAAAEVADFARLVSDILFETNEHLRLTYVSDRLFEVTGIHPDEVFGQPLNALGLFSDGCELAEAIAAHAPIHEAECQVFGRVGHTVWLVVDAVGVFSPEDGRFRGYRGRARDITRLSVCERALGRRDGILEAVARAAEQLLGEPDWRRCLPALAEVVGRAADATTCEIAELSHSTDATMARRVALWTVANPNIGSARTLFSPDWRNVHDTAIAPYAARLAKGEMIRIAIDGPDTAMSPDNPSCTILVPVRIEAEWHAVLRLTPSQLSTPWAAGELQAFRTAAAILGAAMARKHDQTRLAASEARAATAFQLSPDAIALVRLADGVIVEANHTAAQIAGKSTTEIIGRPLIGEDVLADPSLALPLARLLSRHRTVENVDVGIRLRDGSTGQFRISARRIRLQDTAHAVLVARDVSASRKADEMIRRLSEVVEQSPALIMVTDTSGVIEYVNPKFVEVTGYSAAEAIGCTPSLLSSGGLDPDDYRELWETIKCGQVWRGTVRNRRKDGAHFWVSETIAPIRDANGELTNFISVSEDLTIARGYEEQLRFRATHDQVTGLPNRSVFFDQVSAAVDQASQNREKLALILFDLDQFRLINDAFAPEVGDEILRQFGRRLLVTAGGNAAVAGLGGDEFAVLAPVSGSSSRLQKLIGALSAAIARPFQVGSRSISVKASIGAAMFPNDAEDGRGLVRAADTALRRAKDMGGGVQQIFQSVADAAEHDPFELARDLQSVLDGNQLEVFYQPVTGLTTGLLHGAEALVRWRHPRLGLVRPNRFIELAERLGTIEIIGDWVLKEACRQAARWRREGLDEFRVAVNVSSRQLCQGRLVGNVFAALNESRLPPEALVIELTESAVMSDIDAAIETLGRLRSMGVSVALDDFGTGYSSLSYLRRLPLDILKIDRAFVRDIPENGDAVAIATAIISIAHQLQMAVIAEGVETEGQALFLAGHGCERIQGFLVAPPLPADKFAERFVSATPECRLLSRRHAS